MTLSLLLAGTVWLVWFLCKPRKHYSHSEWLEAMRKRKIGCK